MVFHTDGRVLPHDVGNTARLYEDKHGNLWVTHEELLECGYRGLEDFDVVYLNGKFYELQAHVGAAGSWWIEEIEAPDDSSFETSEVSEPGEA